MQVNARVLLCAGVSMRGREALCWCWLILSLSLSGQLVTHSFNHVAGHITPTAGLLAVAQGKGDKVLKGIKWCVGDLPFEWFFSLH